MVRWGQVRTGLVITAALATIGGIPPAAVAAAVAAPADVVPPAVQLGDECPSGYLRGTTHFLEDFDRGVTPTSSGSGVRDPVNGGFFLRTHVEAPDSVGGTSTGSIRVAATGPVVVAFRSRAGLDNAPAGLRMFLDDRQFVWDVPITQSWATFRIDVTGFVTGSPRRLSVSLQQEYDNEGGPSSTIDLDDVTVYSCVPRPPSGVRGDWIGNGRTGLIGVPDDGLLYTFPGNGSGGLLAPRQMGVGWRTAGALASVGDVTGDRRTDLLAVLGGRLVLYPGRGAGALGSGIEIGNGWGPKLATPGDVTGDGRPDLWSVRADGTLHLYRFAGPTTVRYVKQIGGGWASASIVGIGDLNADRRPDALGLLRDGCLRFYPGTAASGLGTGRRLSCGWGIMDWVGSPGDLTGDGRSDLLARRTSDGTLWLYRGAAGGRVGSATRLSTGWSNWRLLA